MMSLYVIGSAVVLAGLLSGAALVAMSHSHHFQPAGYQALPRQAAEAEP